jgi:NAD(P)-dependent dehydrogenase (short-subunit alcohol dehydrogenase family)
MVTSGIVVAGKPMPVGQTLHCAAEGNVNPALLGRVVVVAGSHPTFPDLVTSLVDGGAFVAFVSAAGGGPVAHAGFKADPTDRTVWERVAPHVEQRLGPIDLVVADASTVEVLEHVFRADLVRRGHGDIIRTTADATREQLFSQVVDTL